MNIKYPLICAMFFFLNSTPVLASLDYALTECGVGSMAFEEKGYSAVTNFLFSVYGWISSSSSASSNTSCRGENASIENYLINSYVNLEEELSKGEGPHLTALFSIVGCPKQTHSQLAEKIRRNYPYSSNDTEHHGQITDSKQKSLVLYEKILSEIHDNAHLKSHCQLKSG